MFSKKGLVVEKGAGWATIMLPDGECRRIKTNQYLEVGEFFQYTNMSPIKYMAAAVLLFALLFSSIDYFSVKAYARVSTLAELGVNRWGRVISVKAINSDGAKVLDKIEIKNDKIEVATEKIYTRALQDKRLKNPAEPQVLSVDRSNDNASKLEENLLKKMSHGLQKAIKGQKQTDSEKNKGNDDDKNINKYELNTKENQNTRKSLDESSTTDFKTNIEEETTMLSPITNGLGGLNARMNHQKGNSDKIYEIDEVEDVEDIKDLQNSYSDLLESISDKNKQNIKSNRSNKKDNH